MGIKLTEALIGDCFLPVFGTVEFSRGSLQSIRDGQEPTLVGKGTPFTWDYNNGVLAVYDEQGKPWICSTSYFTPRALEQFCSRHNLRQGALVPHSNDGGMFKRLLAEQTGEHV